MCKRDSTWIRNKSTLHTFKTFPGAFVWLPFAYTIIIVYMIRTLASKLQFFSIAFIRSSLCELHEDENNVISFVVRLAARLKWNRIQSDYYRYFLWYRHLLPVSLPSATVKTPTNWAQASSLPFSAIRTHKRLFYSTRFPINRMDGNPM